MNGYEWTVQNDQQEEMLNLCDTLKTKTSYVHISENKRDRLYVLSCLTEEPLSDDLLSKMMQAGAVSAKSTETVNTFLERYGLPATPAAALKKTYDENKQADLDHEAARRQDLITKGVILFTKQFEAYPERIDHNTMMLTHGDLCLRVANDDGTVGFQVQRPCPECGEMVWSNVAKGDRLAAFVYGDPFDVPYTHTCSGPPVVTVDTSDGKKFEEQCADLLSKGYDMITSYCGVVQSPEYDFCSSWMAVFTKNTY